MSEPEDGDDGRVAAEAERRQFARVNIELVVTLRYPSLGDVVQCQTLDVSEGGVFICTRRLRPEGTQVRFSLEVGEHVLDLCGVVVRAEEPGEGGPAGMGILFKDLGPGAKMLLSALVAQNLATYQGAKTPPRSRGAG